MDKEPHIRFLLKIILMIIVLAGLFGLGFTMLANAIKYGGIL